jgi:hypothetical protein
VLSQRKPVGTGERIGGHNGKASLQQKNSLYRRGSFFNRKRPTVARLRQYSADLGRW